MEVKFALKCIWISFVILSAPNCELYANKGVQLSELMYAPSRGEPEWIELYNNSSDSVNLKGWTIRNKSKTLYILSVTDFYIHAWSYVVITRSATIFSFHPVIPSAVMIVSSLPASFFVNTGDTVSIRDSSGQLIDSMYYFPAWGGGNGKSLERISFGAPSQSQTNWSTSLDSSGSTPGRRNSVAQFNYDIEALRLKAFISGNDTIEFILTIKNSGILTATKYSVDFLVDTAGVENRFIKVGDFNSATEFLPGDSLTIAFSGICFSPIFRAIAVVNFPPDENITNNLISTDAVSRYDIMDIVINEIMYAPSSGEPEWVELFNPTNRNINLKEFTISDNSFSKVLLSSKDYVVHPDSYVVVAHDSSFFTIHPKVSGKVFITPLPQLNNTGDAVVIKDGTGKTIDSVSYKPSWGGSTGGKSLERINALGSSSDPKNFGTCSDLEGSTPNRINSLSPVDYDLSVGSVKASPELLRVGDSVVVSFYIINCGKLTTPESVVGIFFIDSSKQIDSQKVPSIKPSDSVRINFVVRLFSQGSTTLGILVTLPEDQHPDNNKAFLNVRVGVRTLGVVINEIMYAPKNTEQEWIELYNATLVPIDVFDFRISTKNSSVVINTRMVLEPGDYVVICKDSTPIKLHRPFKKLILQPVPVLPNDGGVVLLYDNAGCLVDSVFYLPMMGGSSGKSLERIDCQSNNNDVNWAESIDSSGATPGFANSVAVLPYDISLSLLQIIPDIVDVNDKANVVATIRNVGRDKINAFDFLLRVYRGGSELVSEESGSSEITLNPGDSCQVSYTVALSVPGVYRCMMTVRNQLDTRFRNDTASALLFVRYMPQAVVINEIMYSGTGEYFELYGNSSIPVDLSGWSYRTNNRHNPLAITAGKRIEPGGYFVVISDTAVYNSIVDTLNTTLDRSLSLNDQGGSIVIVDNSGAVIDSVYYKPSWHNPDINSTRGRSLEKINPLLPSNEKTSWSTCVSQMGGTPGKRNSIYVERSTKSSNLKIEPNPFSPDGDGFDDFTIISYNFNTSYIRMRIRIFDMMGRQIAVPVDNVILPSSGNVVWDGRDNSGRVVRFGIYVMYIEVSEPNGSTIGSYKKQVVVAKKMR